MKELTLKATVQNIEVVTEFINKQLEELGCPQKAQMQIDIAIDELFGNIAHYAYPSGTGMATVQIDTAQAPGAATITFIDSGIPFDPLAAKDPDTTLSAGERRIGGLGIYMVKKSMDAMSYEHKDGKNILRITKRF